MTHGCVTLDEVFAAAGVRAASLVPETSGYLALAIGDATSRLPFAIEERTVMLTTEGNVGITRRGDMLPPKLAARGLREMLSRLLAVSQGTAMPALAHASRTREESDRGVDTVVEEIEAALIPVNRAAARRALARLARETIKAKEAGKVKPRPARPPAAEAQAAPPPAPVEPPRPPTPEPPPVAAAPPPPPPLAAPQLAVAQQLVVEATTPPPAEAARRTPTPAPIVAAPRTPTPAPVVVPAPRLELPPPPPEADPTPTVLGTNMVAIDGPALEPASEWPAEPEAVVASPPPLEEQAPIAEAAPAPILDETPTALAPPAREETPTGLAPSAREETPTAIASPAREEVAPAPADEVPTDLGEPSVLMAPSEAPEDAFELGRRPRPIAEPITPPFSLEAEPAPRELPTTRAIVREPVPRAPAAPAHTRADDLLARFGASCVDDASMRDAAACLRRIAGIEPTPAPARVEIRLVPTPAPYEALAQIPQDAETPILPRVRARRAWSAPSLGLTLIVLLAGLAGGGALVRLRPDLFGVSAHPAGAPPVAAPAAPDPGPAAEAPPATAQPTGALAPAPADHLGGARADARPR